MEVSSKASRGDRFYFAVDTPTGVNVLRDSYTTLPDATVEAINGRLEHLRGIALGFRDPRRSGDDEDAEDDRYRREHGDPGPRDHRE